jgi:hypothetical protein
MTRTTKPISAIATLATLLIAGCATQSVPSERLNQVAVVTSGGTNLWTLGRMPTISVVEVDGATPANAYGPIELAPGPHKLKMKCGGNITESQVTVAAGDVYEFSVVMGGPGGCEGSLYRVRSANK